MATAFNDLYSSLTVRVAGAGPRREEPLECFHPVHQSYTRENDPDQPSRSAASIINAYIPGGTPRTIPSSAMKDGAATVYDRDIVTTWRLPGAQAAHEIYF